MRLKNFIRLPSTGTIFLIFLVSFSWTFCTFYIHIKGIIVDICIHTYVCFLNYFRKSSRMLWFITIVVSWILPWNDNGKKNPVSHWNVNALDTHGSYINNKRLFIHGVSKSYHAYFEDLYQREYVIISADMNYNSIYFL